MDFSTLSDMDYAERIAMQNNMDIDKTAIDDLQSQVLCKESMQFLTPAPIHLCAFSKVTPINMLEQNLFSQPSPPDIILYNANIPADLSFWNRNFGVISLFGTNEFL